MKMLRQRLLKVRKQRRLERKRLRELEKMVLEQSSIIEKQGKKILLLEKEIQSAKLWQIAPNRNCYTPKELAFFVGVTEKTIKRHERDGLLIPMYPNAKRKYAKQDVERFLKGLSPSLQVKAMTRMRGRETNVISIQK